MLTVDREAIAGEDDRISPDLRLPVAVGDPAGRGDPADRAYLPFQRGRARRMVPWDTQAFADLRGAEVARIA